MNDWPTTLAEARRVQEALARQVRLVSTGREPAIVAGVDAAFSGDRIIATAVAFTFPELVRCGESVSVSKTPFPYVPGYLSFREGPAMIAALTELPRRPDLIIVDGQGIAHPRRLGIAAHLGVLLGLPSIGSAKSRLVGSFAEPPREAGTWSPLTIEGETVGAVLRTRTGVRPLFVSPGHLVTIDEAVFYVLGCCRGLRLPEPQRAADSLTKVVKKDLAGE